MDKRTGFRRLKSLVARNEEVACKAAEHSRLWTQRPAVAESQLGQVAMIRAACCLQAHHKVTELGGQVEPFASPEDFEKVLKWGERHQKALIVSFRVSEEQGKAIVKRLWPGKSLLGATSGRGFALNTAEEIAMVNEILAPDISIGLDNQKHKWMLQTWPERAK